MKQLRSTAQELRKLFDDNLTVRHLAVMELQWAVPEDEGTAVREFMQKRDFDVMPVKGKGILGYVNREELVEGPCREQTIHPITVEHLVAESAPILDLRPSVLQ